MATKSDRDDRPRKKKKNEAPSKFGLWIGLGLGGLLVLLLLIGLGVVLSLRPWAAKDEEKKPVAKAPVDPKPVQQPDNKLTVRKDPKSLLGRVYYRGTRAELDNELRQIRLF